jgi:diphthamide biosynthesis methyltransferase
MAVGRGPIRSVVVVDTVAVASVAFMVRSDAVVSSTHAAVTVEVSHAGVEHTQKGIKFLLPMEVQRAQQ